MKRYILKPAIILVLVFISGLGAIRAQLRLDFESGLVSPGYNDVRIPGDQGTLFSLSEELTTDPELYFRFRATYTFGSRHNLSLLYAPLTVDSEGSVDRNIIFEGVEFPASEELTGVYKFNSYRLTYRYDIVEKPRFEFGLGFTAKIRDAKISLESADLESEKTNLGFVPIINFMVNWKMTERFSLLLDGDALAAPQGRAEDVLLAVTWRPLDKVGFRAGYRILEGGADNAEVYNFALFNYASLGIMLYL